MADLTEAEILTLAKAAGVSIPPELVTEVSYNLNGLLETLSRVEGPGLDEIEALPILLPPTLQSGRSSV
jgi:hypothetical protein